MKKSLSRKNLECLMRSAGPEGLLYPETDPRGAGIISNFVSAATLKAAVRRGEITIERKPYSAPWTCRLVTR